MTLNTITILNCTTIYYKYVCTYYLVCNITKVKVFLLTVSIYREVIK